MTSVASVEALTDGGLSGDRYAEAKNRRAPDYQVTLIELENIEAFVSETGLPLAPGQPRRNIVTSGVNLNLLCGKRFRIAAAVFEGLELCEPCSLFAKRTHREILQVFRREGRPQGEDCRGWPFSCWRSSHCGCLTRRSTRTPAGGLAP